MLIYFNNYIQNVSQNNWFQDVSHFVVRVSMQKVEDRRWYAPGKYPQNLKKKKKSVRHAINCIPNLVTKNKKILTCTIDGSVYSQ